jgi:hypothetical protein
VRDRSGVVLRAALLAVTVAAALGAVAVPEAGAQDPVAELQALLDRRAQAMQAGDRAAFLATVDPGDAAFVERQELLFDGFQRLELASYDLELTTRYWPELTSSVERDRYGTESDPRVFHVEERYRLEGYDPQPALDDLYLTFVRRGEGWVVASDTDLDDLTLYTGRKLWENGPIVTRKSDHFLYISHPDVASAAGPILDLAERALARVEERWPLDWHGRVPILSPSSTEELRRIIQATFDLDVFVAFAYSGLDRARGWDLVGHRIILNWPNFSRYGEETQESILAHELLHIATREYNGPAVATWVDEGIAEWVSGDVDDFYLEEDLAQGTFDGELPRDFEFITGANDEILQAYEESSTGARYAVDRFGLQEVVEFYRLVGRPRVAIGTSRYHVGRAMRAAWGMSLSTFEDRWARWVETST